MDACPDEADLAEFVRGELTGTDADRVEAHLDDCRACAQVVTELVRIFDDSLGASDQGLPTFEGVPTERSVDGEEDDDDAATLPSGAEVGRYRVLECIGFGGMGVVYSAYDPQLDRRVALKVLRGGGGGAEETRRNARLLREAKVMAKLSHPNVIVVHDVGSFEGRVFLAMEFVDGTTLSRWMRARERSWREIRDTFLAAGRGLAAAHDAGLVHRDFKPDNVLIGDDGRVRVTDFGLARNRDESIEQSLQGAALFGLGPGMESASNDTYATLTKTGVLVGTPAYMAPEQYSGRGVSGATDQFAFCVAFYEALYGERPFEGRTLAELATNVCAGTRRPLGEARVPSRVRDAILRGLSVDPAERFSSMEELLAIVNRRPTRTLRRGAMVAVPTAVAAVSLWWGASSAEAGPVLCRDEGAIASVWSPAARARLDAALAGEVGKDRALEAVDGYARRWSDARTQICAAGGGDTIDVAQGHCLARARSRLEAVLGVISREGSSAERAMRAVSALPDPEPCSSDSLVAANLVPLPPLELEQRVSEGRAELDRILALAQAGSIAEALEALDAATEAFSDIDDAPFQAELRYRQGATWLAAGRYKDARAALEDAAMLGVSSHHRQVSAQAWARLVFMETDVFSNYEAAHRAVRMAQAELAALGNPPGILSVLRSHEAALAIREERYDDAFDIYTALLERPENQDAMRRADILINLVHVHVERGDWEEARAAADEYIRIYSETFGPRHPDLVLGYYNLGYIAYASDDFQGAIEPLAKSVELGRESLPPNHPDLANGLGALCAVYEELSRYEEAVQACLEARNMVETQGQVSKAEVAHMGLALADVRIKSGAIDEASEQLVGLRTAIEGLDDTDLDGQLLAIEGEYAKARGDLAEAQRFLEAAVEAFGLSEAGREFKVGAAQLELAEIVRERGDRAYALELLDAVLRTRRFDTRRLREQARAAKVALEREGD